MVVCMRRRNINLIHNYCQRIFSQSMNGLINIKFLRIIYAQIIKQALLKAVWKMQGTFLKIISNWWCKTNKSHLTTIMDVFDFSSSGMKPTLTTFFCLGSSNNEILLCEGWIFKADDMQPWSWVPSYQEKK